MPTRGTSCAGLAAIVIALLIGCANQNQPQATIVTRPAVEGVRQSNADPHQPVDRRADVPSPEPLDASVGTPDALARKAQTYSREIESLLESRPSRLSLSTARATATATKSSEPAPAPSQVKWADPSDFRLGEFAPASSTVTGSGSVASLAQPVIETSPSEVNRTASNAPSLEPNVTAAANTPARAEQPAPQPAESASVADVALPSADLGNRLSGRMRDYPREVASHLEYQLLLLLLDEQVPALAPLAALPSEDRELVTAVLDGLSLFRSTLRSDNNMLLSKKIRPLIDMADRLRSQADLTIPTVALCRSVEGFGRYVPLEPARFAAGAEHKAIVYCEVANFASNLNAKQQWETRLKQELVLYTEFGVPVWNDRTENIADESRVRRHDFFVNKRITIPKNLTVGRYLLKVSIIDEQANRVAEQTVPIVIAAK